MHFCYYIVHIHCFSLKNNDISQEVLNVFVENFPSVFGENSISYNVHGLLHICETITVVGYPISGSSYAFENYLQTLKRFVRKPTQILAQIYRKNRTKYIKNEKLHTERE